MSLAIQIILIVIAFVLLVYSVVKTIDWFNWFNRKWGNHPHKGKVYVDFGQNELFYDGEMIWEDGQYSVFGYFIEKRYYVVAVPTGYDYIYVRGRRKIVVDFNSENAKPLTANDKTIVEKLIPGKGAFNLGNAIESKLAVDMVKSVTSRQNKLSMIIVIALVAIAAILAWKFLLSKPSSAPANTANVTATITITPPSPADNPYLVK